jgi:hypothetical protein
VRSAGVCSERVRVFLFRVSCQAEDQLCVPFVVRSSDMQNAACPISPVAHVCGHPTTAAFIPLCWVLQTPLRYV